MRIIAGYLKSRLFESPLGHRTHPMSDKVRGALFNALGELDELEVLDAFAGSGALGFEAISRGARQVTALEIDKNAAATIAQNASVLGVSDKLKVIHANAGAWLRTQPDRYFDIVLCDPPYDDLQPALLARLAARSKAGGLVVLSLPPQASVPLGDGFALLSTKTYGDATLLFYRKESP